MDLAPIALFVYKRLRHTRETIESLARNEFAKDSDVFVFSDGARSEADRAAVQEVREYLKTVSGFKNLTVVEREENLGLARSIIGGVTDVVGRYGTVIVLEDDMVTSPYFLKFMNEGLERYRDEEHVISIHGYVYPAGPFPETFFLKGADCWGWATWKRGWALFEPDGTKLYEELKRRELLRFFDFNGAYPYSRMLKDQIAGKNDSWAVRWYASALIHDRLTLYPGRSLISNIGTDDSGTHCGTTSKFAVTLTDTPVAVGNITVAENVAVFEQLRPFLKSLRTSKFRKLVNLLRRKCAA